MHAQNHELEVNLEQCTPHDANWDAIDNGYRMSWRDLGAKLDLTKTSRTLTLKSPVDFSNYDAVTMHIRYELDTELPDGAELFYTKAELVNSINYNETDINICNVITKSQERTIDVVIDPSSVGGFGNIKSFFLQSAHAGDDGGAVYVTDVTFDVHNIVDGVYSDIPGFSTRPYNGDLYLCKDLPVGTFVTAEKMLFFMNTIYSYRPDGEPVYQLWAKIDGGEDVNITPGDGTTKYKTKAGNEECYLYNIADKSKITGIYLRPMCTQGVCGFNADVSAYDSNRREFYRSPRVKFNARTENAAPLGTIKLFNNDKTPGRFTNADRIRMYFNDFYEADGLTGGRYKVSALLDDGTTPLISIPTSASDDNIGRCKTLDIPEDIDRSKIINFTIEPIEGQGEMSFGIATYALDIDVKEKGDYFDEWSINPDKSAHIILNKGDAAPYEPIDGEDLKGFLRLTVVATDANGKVSFVPEFLMNDNSVITASNKFTTTGSGTAHFNLRKMLTKEQVAQVKNVRLRVVSYDDGSIDISRIYLADNIPFTYGNTIAGGVPYIVATMTDGSTIGSDVTAFLPLSYETGASEITLTPLAGAPQDKVVILGNATEGEVLPNPFYLVVAPDDQTAVENSYSDALGKMDKTHFAITDGSKALGDIIAATGNTASDAVVMVLKDGKFKAVAISEGDLEQKAKPGLLLFILSKWEYLNIGSGSHSQAGSRSVGVGEGDATAIDNSQLIIDNWTGAQWYDLQGRKMQGQPTRKGVYVRNGQKVVIR